MKKFIFIFLLLQGICFNAIAQINGEGTFNLSDLFNENDVAKPIDDEKYFMMPNGLYSHSQIMNIPGINQANMLNKVLILVDSTLYSELTFDINRYAYDIHYVYGCNVIMEQVASETCQDIKTLILSHQTNLDGCVFIGDIVPAFYETDRDYADPHSHDSIVWPCDLYYMDLNGIWTDSNNNRNFDRYSGDMKPEIFLGRISTANMSPLIGEIEGMRLYLNKNHKYWIGHRHINKKYALSYTNEDWVPVNHPDIANIFNHSIHYLYGSNNYHPYNEIDSLCFSKTDYLQRLSNQTYEFIQLASHSYSYSHTDFGIANEWIRGNVIYANGIQAIGFNLFCCSACRWTAPSIYAYLAGDYIYSPNSEGLSVVGSTKVGSMYPFSRFYISLGSGKTMGQSLVDWWRNKNTNVNNVDSLLCWNYGMTIIGDPLVNFYHCTNSTCEEYIELNSYGNSSSPLSYNLASGKIVIPQEGVYSIPVGKHCILNAPTVEIDGHFECPLGATLEIINEGCQANCDE